MSVKFSPGPDSHKAIDLSSETVVFTIPVTGWYEVLGEVVRFEPTGKFETVPNPRRHWWTFWRPRTIEREIMNKIVEYSGRETRFLKAGETVNGPANGTLRTKV